MMPGGRRGLNNSCSSAITRRAKALFMVEFSHPHTFYVGAFDDADQVMGYAGIAM